MSDLFDEIDGGTPLAVPTTEPTPAPKPAPGPRVPGNIDLHHRPIVHNADGSISTVRSITVGTDDGSVVLPTVSDDGRILSDDDAVAAYRTSGRHLGIFDREDDANAYAQNLHEQQAQEYHGDIFDEIDAQAPNPTTAMRSAAIASQGIVPNAAAHAVALSRVGVDPRAVIPLREKISADAQQTFDAQHYDDIAERHPELAQWLQQPANAAVARNNLVSLRALSVAMKSLNPPVDDRPDLPLLSAFKLGVDNARNRTVRTLMAGPAWLQDEARSLAGITSQPNPNTPLGMVYDATDYLTWADRARAEMFRPSAARDLVTGLGQVAADPTSALLVPAAGASLAVQGSRVLGEAAIAAQVIKGAAMAQAAIAGGQTMADAAVQLQQHPDEAAGALATTANVAAQTALGYFFGKLGQEIPILRAMNAKPFTSHPIQELGQDIVRNAVTGGSQSAVAGTAQSLLDGHGLPTAEDLVSLYASGAIPGGLLAAANGHEAIVAHRQLRVLQHAEGLRFAEKANNAVDILRSAEVAKLAPEQVGSLVTQLAQSSGVEHVFMPAEAWNNHWTAAGADPAAEAAKVGVFKDYAEAQQTGGDIRVPTRAALAMAKDAANPEALVATLRQAPEAPNAIEAAAFFADKESTATPDEVRAQVAKDAEQAPRSEDHDHISGDIEAKLTTAGYDSTAAKRQADILARFFTRQAERWNAGQTDEGAKLTARSLYESTGLTVSSEKGMGQVVFDQRVPADSLRLTDPEAMRLRAEAEARGELAPADPNAEIGRFPAIQRTAAETELFQSMVPAPGERLDFDALLEQWRKAHGDRTPVPGDGEWNRLVDESRSVDEAKGKQFDQSGTDRARASISFGPDRKFHISLFEGKDLTSFLHESGHLFLEVMGDLVQREGAPEELRKDYAKILDYLGVTERGEIQRAQHEKLARAFETYLMEGKAPAPELKATFQRVKQWFADVYGMLKALGADLTPEVRGVFDRMLASQDEIAAAHGDAPDLWTTKPDWMSEREWKSYRKNAEAAHVEATERLNHQLITELRAEQSEKYRAAYDRQVAAVTADVDGRPVYAALNALQNGKLPEGVETAIKLDRADLVAHGFDPKELPGPKRKANRGRHLYTDEGGVPLDAAAELFGFSSGDEMIQALLAAPDRKQVIKDETKARLRAEGFTDSRTDGSIVERAQDSVQGEKRGAVIAAELRALHKRAREAKPAASEAARVATEAERQRGDQRLAEAKQGADLAAYVDQALAKASADVAKEEARSLASEREGVKRDALAAIPPTELVRAAAREQVGARRVQDLNPNGLLVAIRKASREATVHAANGDWIKAAAAKQRELIAHEMYRATMDAKTEIDKAAAYLKKTSKPDWRAKVGRAGGWEWAVTIPDGTTKSFTTEEAARQEARKTPGATFAQTSGYLEQIDGILDRYDLGSASQDVIARRQSLAEWAQERAAEGEAVDLPKDVLDEAVRVPWKRLTVDQARGVHDAVKNIEAMAREKRTVELTSEKADLDAVVAQGVAELAKRPPLTQTIGRLVGVERIKSWWRYSVGSLKKLSTLARQLDGDMDGGFFQKLFTDPLNKASNVREAMRLANAKRFAALAKEWGKLGPSAAAKKFIPAIGTSLSLEERVGVALHWGNEGNRERLLKGYGWNEGQVGSVLNTLDAKDKTFVEGIWSLINSHWSEVAALEQRTKGFAPEKIDAIPFTTAAGEWTGGYYPAKYDTRLSAAAGSHDLAAQADMLKRGAFSAPATRRGFAQERSEGTPAMPLRLDLGIVGQHLEEVAHHIAYREPIRAIAKVLRQREFQDAIVRHHGIEAWDLINNAVRDAAAGDVQSQTVLEKGLSWVVRGSNTAAMAWNVVVAAMNADGVFHSVQRLGPKYALRGVQRMLRTEDGWREAHRFIIESSPYMQQRGMLRAKTVADITRQNLSIRKPLSHLEHSFHAFTIAVDQVVAWPTWLGAYEQGIDRSMSHAEAVLHADKTVRETQGSNEAHDLAAIQRGTVLRKLFTQFYHYSSVKLNLTMGAGTRFARGGGLTSIGAIGRFASDLALLYVGPALWATLVRTAAGKRPEDESFTDAVAKEVAGLAMGNIPFLRDMTASALEGAGYKGPAGSRGFESIANLMGKIHNEVAHPERDHHIAGEIANVAGVLLHLPSGQATRTIDGITYYLEHGGNPMVMVGGKPRKK